MTSGPINDSRVPQSEVVHVLLDPAETLTAYAAQLRRFADAVQGLDAEALAAPSRCTKWSVADVLRHLCDVKDWMYAMWSGEPPPFESFDAIITPHEFVLAGRAVPDLEVRGRFVASNTSLADDIASSGPERWAARGVSPLGIVPWWLSALHIFWDSWLHERDVFIPLGIEPPVNADEISAVSCYGLALAGTSLSEPIDVVIADIRLVAGTGPLSAEPGPSAPSPDAPVIVDALAGRGTTVEDALRGHDDALVQALGSMARAFSAELP
jgi:uncharacterized protein (TIGR03083 family)